MLYSHNASYPADLPFRISLPDGRTRTAPETFTPEEIGAAGYVAVQDPPAVDPAVQVLGWDGSAWAVTSRDLDTLKAERKALVTSHRWEVETGGITVAGMQVATDDRSKLLVAGKRIKAGENPDMVFRWKSPAGWVDLTSAHILAVADAIESHVQACFDREGELHEAIDAATDSAGVVAVDIATGWPSGTY